MPHAQDLPILLVEDSPSDRALIARALHDRVIVVPDAEAALDAVRRQTFAVMLVDHALPGRSGLELLCEVRQAGDRTPFVLLTESGEEGVALVALQHGAAGCLVKGVGFENALPAIVEHAARGREPHARVPSSVPGEIDRGRVDVLIFEVGTQRHALLAADVQEVLPAVPIAPLPRGPAGVEGVINLRGRLVPVLDIRARLGLPPKPVEHTDHLLVTSAGGRLAAVRTDRAIELASLEVFDAEEGAELAPGIRCVARTHDGAIFVHDLGALLPPADRAAFGAACGAVGDAT